MIDLLSITGADAYLSSFLDGLLSKLMDCSSISLVAVAELLLIVIVSVFLQDASTFYRHG